MNEKGTYVYAGGYKLINVGDCLIPFLLAFVTFADKANRLFLFIRNK